MINEIIELAQNSASYTEPLFVFGVMFSVLVICVVCCIVTPLIKRKHRGY